MGQLRITILVLVLSGYYASAQKRYTCDFEDGMCPFLKNSEDNAGGNKWILGRGEENIGDVGPSFDHTRGNEYGQYLFVNLTASERFSVKLETISLEDHYCLRFFYHMYGAVVPTFKLHTKSDDDQTDNTYFVQLGTQGDHWKEAEIYMNPTDGLKNKGYKAIFDLSGLVWIRTKGDVALDDIELTPGKCPEKKSEAENLCTFDFNDCGYTVREMSTTNFRWKNQKQDYPGFKKQPAFDHTLNTSRGGYFVTGVGLSTEDDRYKNSPYTPSFSSPWYSKPEHPLNCLHFYVWVDGIEASTTDGGDDFLSVQINLRDRVLSLLDLVSTRTFVIGSKNFVSFYQGQLRKWISLKASANITEDFRLQFMSTLKLRNMTSTGEASIAIDDIKLLPGDCPESGFCDFEDDKCTWLDREDGYNWIRKTGKSRTNGEIGPEVDNTKRSPEGSYVVFNALGKDPGTQASLQSQYLPSFYGRTLLISFFYQMSGTDPGSLEVIHRGPNIPESTVWSVRGDQGAIWKKGTVELKHSEEDNQIVFMGTIGTGENGFIALDDIRIRGGKYEDLDRGSDNLVVIVVSVVLVILLISSVGCLVHWCYKSKKNKEKGSSSGSSNVI